MHTLQGAGLGFRREMLHDLKQSPPNVDFFEIAPENWLGLGGRFAADLHYFTERYPFVCHGLSLSLGGTEPIDQPFLQQVKQFIHDHQIRFYTEHLSWCTDDGHLYDLLPIPCTFEAVNWLVSRIQQVQEILGMQIGIENASTYLRPANAEMSEEMFIHEIVQRSGCFLHLDVNNIYVNSQNFHFNPLTYLNALPLDKVGYIHIAGHYTRDDGIIIDSHGAEVIDPVWQLLADTYSVINDSNLATCLERDFNYPGMTSLLKEVDTIKQLQACFSHARQGEDHVRTKFA